VNSNIELESWRATWKNATAAQPEASFDLWREARRHERRLRAQYVSSLGFAVALMGFAALVLRRNNTVETLVWAIVVWLTTLLATAFSIQNWRVLWRSVDQSTADFVAAYRGRCVAMLRAVRFGYGLLACQLTISVPWLTLDFHHSGASGRFGPGRYAFSIGLLGLLTAAYLYAFRRFRCRAMRELARLEEFDQSTARDEVDKLASF
jgi:hypothetical protein